MCGIGGIVARHPVSSAWTQAMNARMTHRGPDGAGVWASPDGRVQLAHRRLAILDLSERGVNCERRLKRPEDQAQRREAIH